MRAPGPQLADEPTTPDAPEEAAPEEEAGEPDDGSYEIVVTCRPDGTYTVAKEGEPEQQFDSFEEALKQVVRLHRANPMGASPSAAMQAGYGAPQ